MKRVVLFCLVILFAISVDISAQSRVAMTMPIKGFGNVDDFDISTLSAALEEAINKSGNYRVVARGAAVEAIMKDFDFESQGVLTDGEKASLAAMENVDFICMSSIDNKNGTYLLRAKFIDKNNGEYSNIVSAWLVGWDLIYEKCGEMALRLTEGYGASISAGNIISLRPSVKSDYVESAYGINMEMVYVQGGEFLMGGTSEQGSDAESDEQVIRRVNVGDFYIGRFEVTQSQWESVMGTSVSQQRDKANPQWSLRGTGPNNPMYYVSWEEASEFCRILSRKTGRTYRLPTEAEWEYAARGGQKNDGTKYSGSNLIDYAGWYDGNSASSTHPVGTKNPNELGIYDMSGNVWEWCRDWYAGAYDRSQTDNPTGPVSGSGRVLRGGSWYKSASDCRVSDRNWESPDNRYYNVGFRVVCLP